MHCIKELPLVVCYISSYLTYDHAQYPGTPTDNSFFETLHDILLDQFKKLIINVYILRIFILVTPQYNIDYILVVISNVRHMYMYVS